MRRAVRALLIAVLLVGAPACSAQSGSGAQPTSTASSPSPSPSTTGTTAVATTSTLPPTLGVAVTDALARNLTGQVTLTGYLVIEAGSARLCELLLEVTPPACGGVSVSVAGNVDAPGLLDNGAGLQWSPFPVDLSGSFSGSKLVADGPPPQLVAQR